MKIKETGLILFLENYEDNVKFYTDKLGLNLREKKEGLSKLDFGGSYLMIENKGILSITEKTRAENPTVIRIEVEDFAEAVREIENRGVTIQVQK